MVRSLISPTLELKITVPTTVNYSRNSHKFKQPSRQLQKYFKIIIYFKNDKLKYSGNSEVQ